MARCRRKPRRASFFAAALGCCLAHAESACGNCEDLPPSARAACWMTLACASIDDRERRSECFRAAAERFEALGSQIDRSDTGTPATPPVEPVAAAPVPRATADPEMGDDSPLDSEPDPSGIGTPATPPAKPVAATPVPPATANPPTEDESARGKEESSGAASPSAPVRNTDDPIRKPQDARDDVWRLVEVPRRFSAALIGTRTLARDRLLFGLDNQLLFEGGGAHVSGLGAGDVLKAFRVSYSTRRYRFVGPSHRAFEATRIRCEHPNPTADTRRKCALLKRWLSRPDS